MEEQPDTFIDEKEMLKKIMENPIYKVKCLKCQDVLESIDKHDFKKCRCGTISIDGGRNKNERRFVGDLKCVDLCN